MYRVIFLFDIGDIADQVEVALERMAERQYSPVDGAQFDQSRYLTDTWFRYRLIRDFGLAIYPPHNPYYVEQMDIPFQDEVRHLEGQLYHEVSQAIFHEAHPCIEYPCLMALDRRTLTLTFDVGTNPQWRPPRLGTF